MIEIRQIRKNDDHSIYEIIRNVMNEFNADPITTVLADPSIKHMYENYQGFDRVYYVAVLDNEIAGGAGIRQLEGTSERICELQRMFLLPEARGKGIGKLLIKKCIESAKKQGYEAMYLESMSQMKSAIALYEKSGFRPLKAPMGNTGHGGCNVWMMLPLNM